MSQSNNLPEWVDPLNEDQVVRAKYLTQVRKKLVNKSEGITPFEHYDHFQDTSLHPVERLVWGVFLLGNIMEEISEIRPEIEGVKGLTHVLMTELASNLQMWVKTGDYNFIEVPLDLCQVAFGGLMETEL